MELGAVLDNKFIFIEEIPLKLLTTDYKTHHRLGVFAEHGLQCVCCAEKGTHLVRSMDPGGGIHVDLYSDDWVLLTVDHIVSKAEARKMGWTKQQIEALSNKQPMCTYCNGAKGHKDITVEELREQRQGVVLKYVYAYLINLLGIYTSQPLTCRFYQFTSGGSSRCKNSPFNMPKRRRNRPNKRKMEHNLDIMPQLA